MFISKANLDDKREFFPGLISIAVETKTATLNVQNIVSFCLETV